MQVRRPGVRAIGSLAVGVMVLGTGFGAQAAVHKKPIVRHQSISYQGACVLVTPVVTGGPSKCPAGADATLVKRAGEKYISIVVKDATGQPVSGELWASQAATTSKIVPFCGSLKNYVPASSTIRLTLNEGVDTKCPGGEATQGTIAVTYSSLRQK